MLLWLWCRLAAVAPTGALAWEPPYAASAALKSEKKKKKARKRRANKIERKQKKRNIKEQSVQQHKH